MLLLIDKPKGITSHDVVDKVRKITGEKRVGHAGTLDPNARGLLIVGLGRESTKKLGDISKNSRKTYVGEVFLGEERDTDDVEGMVISKAKGVLPPTRNEIMKMLQGFLGEQEQVPPKYSAVKIKGRKAYELARKGQLVRLKPRKVKIYRIKLLVYKYPLVKFEAEVSAGTYIRSLARDLGRRLGCGGYLNNLCRVRIGSYRIEEAFSLAQVESLMKTKNGYQAGGE